MPTPAPAPAVAPDPAAPKALPVTIDPAAQAEEMARQEVLGRNHPGDVRRLGLYAEHVRHGNDKVPREYFLAQLPRNSVRSSWLPLEQYWDAKDGTVHQLCYAMSYFETGRPFNGYSSTPPTQYLIKRTLKIEGAGTPDAKITAIKAENWQMYRATLSLEDDYLARGVRSNGNDRPEKERIRRALFADRLRYYKVWNDFIGLVVPASGAFFNSSDAGDEPSPNFPSQTWEALLYSKKLVVEPPKHPAQWAEQRPIDVLVFILDGSERPTDSRIIVKVLDP